MAVWEIQYHPASIRGTVRFFFLTARTRRWLAMGFVAVVSLVGWGVTLAPQGVRTLALAVRLAAARQEGRAARGELARRLAALEALERRVAALREFQRRIALALGATVADVGAGGYALPPVEPLNDATAQAAVVRAAKLETACGVVKALAEDLDAFAARHTELVRTVPSRCPLPHDSFVLTSPFGARTSPFTGEPDFHLGIDLAASEGTPVMATGAGTVIFAGRIPLHVSVHWWRYGNLVVVRHGQHHLTLYSHLREVAVGRGERVARGQVVGAVGNTGWSTAPHLHYEVRMADERGGFVPVDPRIFVLDYRWSEQEMTLAASRSAPPPAFEPLPPALLSR